MNKRNPKPPSQGISLSDALFAIFKRKWLILIFSTIGIVGGAAVFLSRKPIYESRASLLVRYVVDSSPLDGHESKVATGGRSGSSVMQTELAILTSWDIIAGTVEAVGSAGADGVVHREPGNESAELSAGQIFENLTVSTASGGSVIRIAYTNEDPVLAREVLQELVSRYFEKHLNIHRDGGDFDFVTQQADLVRTQLRRTEDELKTKKQDVGIISLSDATASVEAQRARISSELLEAEVALTAQVARLKAYEELRGIKRPADGNGGGKNENAGGKGSTSATVAAADPAENIQTSMRYRTIISQLAHLNERQFELEMKFRTGALLDLNQREIKRLRSELESLVKKNPGLVGSVGTDAGPARNEEQGMDLISMRAELAALQARAVMLKEQQAVVVENFNKLSTASYQIQSLESKRQIEEENYQNSQTSLGKARIDDAIDSTKMPNISFIERPSAAAKSYGDTGTKIAAGLGVGGILIGLGLAFLLEFIVDQRVKRPMELESRFRIPLMMSIPRIGTNGASKHLAMDNGHGAGGGGKLAKAIETTSSGKSADLLAHGGHFIHPYADAIRDRLGYYFELNNMTHKPKLIALTGLSEGAGSTTLAAGLAASFAEIEDSTVLYLDMNAFQDGDGGSLEWSNSKSLREALGGGDESGLDIPGENLYVATIPARSGENGSKRLGTKNFYDLMPKFRASQFDYIVFDMPPLGPTSPTPAMTGFMDRVILVLDAQNTDRELLQQGYGELAKGNADVTCIFNKTRSQAPRWVQGAA